METQHKMILHPLPTAEYVTGKQRTTDTQLRILRTLNGGVQDIEMMLGWCRQMAYEKAKESIHADESEIAYRNRKKGESVAYEDMAERLERLLERVDPAMQELSEVMDL